MSHSHSSSFLFMAGTIFALAGGVAAWVAALFNGQSSSCPDISDLNSTLMPLLSSGAGVWSPGTRGFEAAMERWTPWIKPQFEVVVDVATEEDVGHVVRLGLIDCMSKYGMLTSMQIQYANGKEMPFLALSGKHGYNNNLNRVKHGIGINLRRMNSVKLAQDGKTARLGGGILSYEMLHGLWDLGKITSMFLQ